MTCDGAAPGTCDPRFNPEASIELMAKDSENATDQTVLIQSLSSEGDGVGRLADGRVVFVEGGVPGDEVELTEVVARKRFVRAKVGRVVSASPDRIAPRCAHFGDCGGCRWQHVDYAAQLDAKKQIVRDALVRIGGLDVDVEIDIVPSPDPYAYRARARWVEGESGLGYRVRGSRTVSPIEDCPVLVPSARKALGDRLEQLRKRSAASASVKAARREKPREWTVTAGSEGDAIVRRAFASANARSRSDADGAVRIESLGESLRVSAHSFMQGNALLWESLQAAVRDACLQPQGGETPEHFTELYCGVGFFTIPLARAMASGVVLESDRSAIRDLAFNLRSAGLEGKVEVLSGPVEERGDLVGQLHAADVALVDPPRIGLDDRVRVALAAALPRRLVYLSCNPATLARDLKDLVAAGYTPKSIQAFDLFPQTPHTETLITLETPI